jgi:ABC-type phosphate/phosphonate transport system substrate-binding protein
MIASAQMYSWSPEIGALWRKLLEWVADRANVSLEFIEENNQAPLDELWSRSDLGCAFMCGYPWALRADPPHLLAAPVPSPARYRGQPVYVSDFIVRADSDFMTLEDTFGSRIAYSSIRSHSGYNAARFHLLMYRTGERSTLYREVLGPLHRQRAVVDAVVDGRADMAAIDGYALDLLRRHQPNVANRLRVVASTAPAPSPPMVSSPAITIATRRHLTAALLEAHRAPELSTTLEALLLARFVAIQPAQFEVFLERERAAVSAGYPTLA